MPNHAHVNLDGRHAKSTKRSFAGCPHAASTKHLDILPCHELCPGLPRMPSRDIDLSHATKQKHPCVWRAAGTNNYLQMVLQSC